MSGRNMYSIAGPKEAARGSALDCRGLSLIEVLIVVAIAAILFLVLQPVFITSKRQAMQSDSTSRLHQLGLAAQIYSEANGLKVRSCFELVEAGQVQSSLCTAPLDPTQEGYSNIVMRQLSRGRLGDKSVHPRPYKLSFVGSRDANVSDAELAKASSNLGWLIDLSPSESESGGVIEPLLLAMRKGVYLRLLEDTSVVRRVFTKVSIRNKQGQTVECSGNPWLFADFEQKIMEEQCGQIQERL
ncbi:MAG: type II secretion system protein [Fimbriimonadaceae bacterium]|nr:type II secretion system protein [Fimbriimonadaceae bacterium]QYK56250.1 MAG: type II secretion system protein [Fimbriimonadaceae bacterium]